MSEASAVVVFGPGGGDGVIGRGPTRTLYAIHYARPCLVTQARLNGATAQGSRVDPMILDESPQRRAAIEFIRARNARINEWVKGHHVG